MSNAVTQASLPGPSWPRALYALALLLAILPLWVSHSLPIVDLPQHLHLISVLHRLDDPTTLFPRLYAERGTLTPYLGYYYLVHGLSWLMPLEMANRLFLSAYVAGFALALGFLLRSLGRPAWPSLLALPFAYGDSFGWGFVNYVAALPLALLTCGLFVRSIDAAQARARTRAAVAMGAALISVLLFHVQAFAFLAVALPWLLVTTPAPDGAGTHALRPLAPRAEGGPAGRCSGGAALRPLGGPATGRAQRGGGRRRVEGLGPHALAAEPGLEVARHRTSRSCRGWSPTSSATGAIAWG